MHISIYPYFQSVEEHKLFSGRVGEKSGFRFRSAPSISEELTAQTTPEMDLLIEELKDRLRLLSELAIEGTVTLLVTPSQRRLDAVINYFSLTEEDMLKSCLLAIADLLERVQLDETGILFLRVDIEFTELTAQAA